MTLEHARRAVKLASMTYTGVEFEAARTAILSLVYMCGFSEQEVREFESEVFNYTPVTPV